MLQRRLYLFCLIAMLYGCATAPSLAPLLEIPATPGDRIQLVKTNVHLPSSQDLHDNVVQSIAHKIKPGSSIVINVPHAIQNSSLFNDAELEIERELIRHGFLVLSRSKFEAKLRDLRGRNPAASDAQQLTDISEVIRAAQSGATRSDYVLHINNFEHDKAFPAQINLLANNEIKSFFTAKPHLEGQFKPKQYLECVTNGVELNAKLIHVKSGAIIWLGKHQVHELSQAISNITVEVGERIFANNLVEIANFVNQQNQPAQRERRYGKSTQLPEWQYAKALIGPRVIAGHCESAPSAMTINNKTRVQLVRTVAKELVQTIKMN